MSLEYQTQTWMGERGSSSGPASSLPLFLYCRCWSSQSNNKGNRNPHHPLKTDSRIENMTWKMLMILTAALVLYLTKCRKFRKNDGNNNNANWWWYTKLMTPIYKDLAKRALWQQKKKNCKCIHVLQIKRQLKIPVKAVLYHTKNV